MTGAIQRTAPILDAVRWKGQTPEIEGNFKNICPLTGKATPYFFHLRSRLIIGNCHDIVIGLGSIAHIILEFNPCTSCNKEDKHIKSGD